MLAVDRVEVVPFETALGALVAQLVRPENGLRQAQEQGNPSDHDDHCEEPTGGSGQHDVAEAGGGQRRHGEVERIDIADDVGIMIGPQHENQGTHEEDEDAKVHRTDDDVLVTAEERRVAAQVAQYVVGMQQAQGSEHPEKTEVLRHQWRQQERQDDHHVGYRIDLAQHPCPVWGDPQAGEEVCQDQYADHEVGGKDRRRRVKRYGSDEEHDGRDVEAHQEVAEHRCLLAGAGIQQVNRLFKLFRCFAPQITGTEPVRPAVQWIAQRCGEIKSGMGAMSCRAKAQQRECSRTFRPVVDRSNMSLSCIQQPSDARS